VVTFCGSAGEEFAMEVVMEKLHKGLPDNKTIFCLLILFLSGLLACAGVGSVVPEDRRVLFNEMDKGEGSFDQGGLTVTYSYHITGRRMSLNGQVDYPKSFDSLNVRLQFLDAAGRILQQKIVYFSGYRVSRSWTKEERTFQQILEVPSGARGISFSYFLQPRRNYR